MTSDTDDDAVPDRCVLKHQVFTMLGTVSFRRARADGMPVMVVTLGEREAVVPLRALQREFGIADDTPDGRMLGLIVESLDYVCGLSLGDRLPSEVLSGRASWEPSLEHRKRAFSIVRMQLIAWLDPDAADPALGDPMVAGQTGEVMSALRNMESQQAFIRSNRDQLYRAQRSWQTILDGWADAAGVEEVPWELISQTYKFLAPRYMPVTEWASNTGPARGGRTAPTPHPVMSW